MLDATHSQTPVWQDQLSPGDIVMFRFPGLGQPTSARPMPRPCLVLDIEIVRGRRCAVLVPAVPFRRPAGRDRQVTLGKRAEWRAAGLEQPTAFPLRSRLLVPLAHEGFVVAPGTGSPVLGHLPEAVMERRGARRATHGAATGLRSAKRGVADHAVR